MYTPTVSVCAQSHLSPKLTPCSFCYFPLDPSPHILVLLTFMN